MLCLRRSSSKGTVPRSRPLWFLTNRSNPLGVLPDRSNPLAVLPADCSPLADLPADRSNPLGDLPASCCAETWLDGVNSSGRTLMPSVRESVVWGSWGVTLNEGIANWAGSESEEFEELYPLLPPDTRRMNGSGTPRGCSASVGVSGRHTRGFDLDCDLGKG